MADSHHFFAYLARMRFIRRWGLMRNTTEENIQEHSLQVALIAHGLSPGAALVFSSSLLHEALPVTAGRRFVVLGFLSGDH